MAFLLKILHKIFTVRFSSPIIECISRCFRCHSSSSSNSNILDQQYILQINKVLILIVIFISHCNSNNSNNNNNNNLDTICNNNKEILNLSCKSIYSLEHISVLKGFHSLIFFLLLFKKMIQIFLRQI